MTVLRVLVVDDDPLQLELVERSLARDGFEVRGVSKLAQLAHEATTFVPHLVLIDVNMPDASGEQVVAIARDLVIGALLVLYSAWEEPRLRSLAKQLGADGYVSKSESVVTLGQRLRELHKR